MQEAIPELHRQTGPPLRLAVGPPAPPDDATLSASLRDKVRLLIDAIPEKIEGAPLNQVSTAIKDSVTAIKALEADRVADPTRYLAKVVETQKDRLHDAQREVFDSPARFRVLACGRRWGKTELGKAALLAEAAQGGFCWWIAPTYGVADEVWRDLKTTLDGCWTDKDEGRHRLTLAGGGVIQVRSGHDPDYLRGVGLDLAVLDEAAFMPEEVWTGSIRPALADRGGRALFLSTPNGLNWFHRLYQMGLDPLLPDWGSFHHTTASGPLVPQEEVDQARLETPDRWFRQEYLAEFVEDAGHVFRNIDLACTARPARRRKEARYTVGIDWGRVDDYTAFAVFDVQRKRLVALDRFRQVSWQQQRDRLKAVFERWGPDVIWAEANSIGSVNVEALQRDGLPVRPFTTTAQSKGPLIESLALAMERESITLLDDPVLRGELAAYTVERLPSGHYRYGAAPGAHDDTVIAVALGWYGVRHAGAAVSFV